MEFLPLVVDEDTVIPDTDAEYDFEITQEPTYFNLRASQSVGSLALNEVHFSSDEQIKTDKQLERVKAIVRRREYTASKKARRNQARTLKTFIASQDNLGSEVASYLIDIEHSKLVVENLKLFPEVDHQALADMLIQEGHLSLLVTNLKYFRGLSEETAITLLQSNLKVDIMSNLNSYVPMSPDTALIIAKREPREFMKRLEKFPDVDLQALLDVFFEIGKYELILSYTLVFGIDFMQTILKIIAAGGGRTIVELIEQRELSRFDVQVVVDALFENDSMLASRVIFTYPYETSLTKQQLANLVERGFGEKLIECFPELKTETVNYLFQLFMLEGNVRCALRCVRYCSNLDNVAVEFLVANGASTVVLNTPKAFNSIELFTIVEKSILSGTVNKLPQSDASFKKINDLSALVTEQFSIGTLSYRDVCHLINLCNVAEPPTEVTETRRIFGEEFGEEGYQWYRAVKEGTLTDELVSLGITQTGNKGIEQLERSMQNFQTRLLDLDNETIDLLLKHDSLFDIYRSFVRYNVSQWGSHNHLKLRRRLAAARSEPLDSIELPEGYRKSGIIALPIKGSDSEQTERDSISEDAVARYGHLRRILQTAVESIEGYTLGTVPYLEQKEALDRGVKDKLGRMALAHDELVKVGKMPNADFLKKQIAELTATHKIGFNSYDNLEETFMLLQKDKQLSDAVMVILAAKALRFDQKIQHDERRQRFEYAKDTIAQLKEAPTHEDIAKVIDLVGHIIVQEGFRDEFIDARAQRVLRELFSVKSLTSVLEDDSRQENTANTLKLQFIPSRGILMELSGHIGDACWADRYDSIAESFSNMTSVIMMRHYQSRPPRLIGSMILIETRDQVSGQDVVVVRGLNPIQNVINKVDVEAFYATVKQYVGEIAANRGRSVGIVIDDMSGMAGTNRPQLHTYLAQHKQTLRRMQVPHKDTEFNGYDISNKVFAV
ncbi:MAG: hypothetical protein ACOH18_00165 [Candidatus Saccharimonadaceae bacterium]